MAVTVYGVYAVTFMMAMYALEARSRHFISAFALDCAPSSSYGFLAWNWPFGVVEAVSTVVALRRSALTTPHRRLRAERRRQAVEDRDQGSLGRAESLRRASYAARLRARSSA